MIEAVETLPQICVTGREATVVQLAERLDRFSGEEALQEVRLDALAPFDGDVFDLIRRYRGQVVATCRPERQGGWFGSSESDRLEILARASAMGPRLMDIEFDVPRASIDQLKRSGCAVLLSFHDFSGVPDDLGRIIREMEQNEVEAIKIAVQIHDAAELSVLLAVTSSRPKVVLGMGAAGILSRVLFDRFGSLWTYVSAGDDENTANGQLTWERALLYGFPESASAPFLALVGGEQVSHSPGPVVYNRLFRGLPVPNAYIPVITLRFAETLELLRELGCTGASVTMPHKRQALLLSDPDDSARSAGAANTVRFDSGMLQSTNSDIEGVRLPLETAMLSRGEKKFSSALILGAGGAARAAALACQSLGVDVTVASRRLDEAELSVRTIPWTGRSDEAFDILINATPIAGTETPWPTDVPIGARIVFDLAISPAPSLLLDQAGEAGAVAIPAEEMWLAQGALQMTWLTGMETSAEQLRELMP